MLSLYFITSTDLRPEIFAIPLYHNSFGTVTSSGLEIDINLNRDVQEIRRHIIANLAQYTSTQMLEDPANFNLNLVDRKLRIFVGDSTWNFVTQEPDNTIAQPGSISNIVNGLGYFGGLGTNFGTFPVTDQSVRLQIGFSS